MKYQGEYVESEAAFWTLDPLCILNSTVITAYETVKCASECNTDTNVQLWGCFMWSSGVPLTHGSWNWVRNLVLKTSHKLEGNFEVHARKLDFNKSGSTGTCIIQTDTLKRIISHWERRGRSKWLPFDVWNSLRGARGRAEYCFSGKHTLKFRAKVLNLPLTYPTG